MALVLLSNMETHKNHSEIHFPQASKVSTNNLKLIIIPMGNKHWIHAAYLVPLNQKETQNGVYECLILAMENRVMRCLKEAYSAG